MRYFQTEKLKNMNKMLILAKNRTQQGKIREYEIKKAAICFSQLLL